jgi:cobalt-zinc-cadmium efflux system membrane fusion protein
MRGVVFVGIGVALGFGAAYALFRAPSAGDSHAVQVDAEPAMAEPPAAAREISLSEDLYSRAKLVTETLEPRQLAPSLDLVGSITFDADALADVGGRVEGRITRTFVTVGDKVVEGQPHMELESQQIGDAIAQLLSTRANLIAAENRSARETALGEKQLSTAAVVESARADAKALAAEQQGAEQRLLAMGFSPAEIRALRTGDGPRRVTLRAPIAGEVVQRFAVLGQVVDPTEPILRIADLKHLWVELDVYERDLAHVAVGDHVDISSETYPGRSFPGVVHHVNAIVDVATRTAQVRIEVDNPERLLRPGQFVHARLSTSGTAETVLSVPRRALLQVEGEPTVFVVSGPRAFTPRPVQSGRTSGDLVEIVRGLKQGDVVVTEGAFVLKSEMLR